MAAARIASRRRSAAGSALFLQMNRNKRSMTLDPASADGREIVARLVRTADVVIANLPEAALQAMGLDYATLSGYRPDIIVVTNTAFGTSGPMSHQVGFDGVGQAMSGAVYMTGQPDEPYRAIVNGWISAPRRIARSARSRR